MTGRGTHNHVRPVSSEIILGQAQQLQALASQLDVGGDKQGSGDLQYPQLRQHTDRAEIPCHLSIE